MKVFPTYRQQFYCILIAVLWGLISCTREYSFEGNQIAGIRLTQNDTVLNPSFLLSCNQCNNNVADSSWQLEVEGARLCGIAEKTVIDIDRKSFTFFGPSRCSTDSGFVISVYLSESLNRNRTNLQADRIAFYYYDRVTPSYILQTTSADPFTFLIEEYNHQSGKAIGRFHGTATTESGIKKAVLKGRFAIQFK